MGKLVDQDFLWLRETPQNSSTRQLSWRPWAPLALIPVAAIVAWVMTAPETKPASTSAHEAIAQSARPTGFGDDPVAKTIAVNFVPPDTPSRAAPDPGLHDLAFSPAQPLTTPGASQSSWHRVTIQAGDTLSLAFARNSLSYMDSLRIAHLPRLGHYFTRDLQAGDVMRVKADHTGRVEGLSYEVDPLHLLSIRRHDGKLTASLTARRANHRRAYASGVVHSNFYQDALDTGLTDRQVAALRHIFSREIDFGHSVRVGDRFVVVYDELYRNHKKIGDGPILAAAIDNNGHVIRALRRTDAQGHSQYYRPDGRPMRQAFMRAPVDYTRISSPFSLHRMNPILHVIRPHYGTDYAAPSGTPIHATGAGRIIFEGREGGYGKVVIIRHDRHITMRFAHMSHFTHRLHVGSHVKPGQTIGYVGMTGLATGPHVHYEFRVDGKPRNPQTVTLPGAAPLTGSELAAFKRKHRSLIARLDTISGHDATRLAAATTADHSGDSD